MNYLVVSCSTYDMAGRAMIQGAINGIAQFDKHAHFASLEPPQHHSDWIGWYCEPEKNAEAFQWADVILDIAGLHTNQTNKYYWLALRMKYKKPYIFMSQSFKSIDPVLFKANHVKIVARGKRSAQRVRDAGFHCEIAPDLSFLINPVAFYKYKPEDVIGDGPSPGDSFHLLFPKRIFNTHIGKFWETMASSCDAATDIQIVEKKPQGDKIWEPVLPIPQFFGTPEKEFGLVAQAEEIHVARYQLAVAAILAGKRPRIYKTGNPDYDEKYLDLMDYYGQTAVQLREAALISCRLAWEAASANA